MCAPHAGLEILRRECCLPRNSGKMRHRNSGEMRPSLWSLAPPVFAFSLANFWARPLVTQVLLQVVCRKRDPSDCNSTEVSAEASLVDLYSELALNVPSLAVSGMFAQLSDQRGRRIAMICPLFGQMVYYAACSYVSYSQSPSYVTIIVGSSFVQGMLGASGAFNMAVFSYVADLTSVQTERRGSYFSLLEAATFLAKMAAPTCSGLWAEHAGFTGPLLFSGATVLVGALWVLLCMSESNPPVEEAVGKPGQMVPPPHAPLRLDPLQTIRNASFVLGLQSPTGLRSPAALVVLSYFLYNTAYQFERAVAVLYEKHVFSFSPSYVGYLDSLQNSLLILSMALPTALYLSTSFQMSDAHWVLLGLLGKGAFYLCYPFATNTWQVFSLSVVLLLCGSVVPRAHSICANLVTSQQQAQMQACFAALQATSLLLSIFASLGWAGTVQTCPGAMYFLCFALVCCAVVLVAGVLLSPPLAYQLSHPLRTAPSPTDEAGAPSFLYSPLREGGIDGCATPPPQASLAQSPPAGQRIVILSRPIRTGKSTQLMDWVEQQAHQGVGFAGFAAPTHLPGSGGRKMLVDLLTRQVSPLEMGEGTEAEAAGAGSTGTVAVGKYHLNAAAFARADEMLERALLQQEKGGEGGVQAHIWFVVDEAGPLEVRRGEGHHSLLVRLFAAWRGPVLVVVREGLTDAFQNKYGRAERVIASISEVNC